MAPNSDPDARLARDAADRLLGDTNGVNLTGPQARIEHVITGLQGDLDQSRLFPVLFQADQGTPESLRVAVGRAHTDRPSLETGLLLIVPDAGRLSVELLRELELAAEAAARFGGLKFLLASKAPLRPMLREAGLHHLFDRLDASLTVPPDTASDGSRLAGSLLPRPAAKPGRPGRRPTGLGARLLLAGAILLVLLLLILLVLDAVRPGQQSEPVPTRPAAPGAVSNPTPTSVYHAPLPAAPTPVPAPAAQQPPDQTPPSQTPLGQTQAGPAAASREPANPTSPTPMQAAPTLPPSGPVLTTPPGSSDLLLMAQPGDTLPVLYAKVYAGRTPPPYAAVVALNPIVRPGTRLIFPPPPGGWHPAP